MKTNILKILFLFLFTTQLFLAPAASAGCLLALTAKAYSYLSFKKSKKIELLRNNKLQALHIKPSQNQFPSNAPLHAVIFDSFGSKINDFAPAKSKVEKLTGESSNTEHIVMGAEAFSPTTPHKSAEDVATWMETILLSTRAQAPDQRPLVIYAKGNLAEGAIVLAKRRPDLVSSLVLENPLSSTNSLPDWNSTPINVPTFILTGTHDGTYPSGLKQNLYDFSKNARIASDADPSLPTIHYLDMPFADANVFERTPRGIAYEEISRFLQTNILNNKEPSIKATSPEEFIETARQQGIGLRRFFGHKPKPTPENEVNAIQSGVLMWETGLKPVSSIEEAMAHVEKMNAVTEKPSNGIINRPLFFISDSKKLSAINKSLSLEDALRILPKDPTTLIADAISKGNKFFTIDLDGRVQEFDPSLIQNVPTEAVHMSENKNGFMFNLSGWTLPVIRGTINLAKAQETGLYKDGNNLFNGVYDRKGNLVKPGIITEGFHFEKNKNLFGVLEKLRNMQRKGQSENSTRFLDPYNVILMQRLYEANLLDTIELYDGKGELIAGGLIVKLDNVWSPETVFYPPANGKRTPVAGEPLSATLEGIQFSKIVVAQMINEGVRLGHTEFDSQIASSFTVLVGAEYVDTDNVFLPSLKETNATWEQRQRQLQEAELNRQRAIEETLQAAAPKLRELKAAIDKAQRALEEAERVSEEKQLSFAPTKEQKRDPEVQAAITAGREAKKAVTKAKEELNRAIAEHDAFSESLLKEKSTEETPVQISFEEAQATLTSAQKKYEKTVANAEEAEAEAKRLEAIADNDDAKKARRKAESIKANIPRTLQALEDAKAKLKEIEES
ncbi:MAG: hypothetical protein R3A80_11515 [Bdellovibrionota bacterium]